MAEIKFQLPEGYECIDEEKSDFPKGIIVLKKKEATPWRYNRAAVLSGYFVEGGKVKKADNLYNIENARDVFAAKKQAQSMLAMSQLSQIIKNDERFGGPLTDEEWTRTQYKKYVIIRGDGHVEVVAHFAYCYFFLAFHTEEQADLFLKENEDLIRQYYMLD